jgi:hypothetical protein
MVAGEPPLATLLTSIGTVNAVLEGLSKQRALGNLIKKFALCFLQTAIILCANEQFHSRRLLSLTIKEFENVCLPIGSIDHRGIGNQLGRLHDVQKALNPTVGFLLLDRAFGIFAGLGLRRVTVHA